MFEEWSQYVFGVVGSQTVQYVVTFIVIFSALSAFVVMMRRRHSRREEPEMRPGQRGRKARLGIVDVYEMDAERRLILLRRDNVEHLLLVGGPNDLVIERHIQRTLAPRPEVRDDLPEASPEGPGGDSRRGPRTDPMFPSYLPAPEKPRRAIAAPSPGVDLTKRDPAEAATVAASEGDASDAEGKPRTDHDLLTGMAAQLEAALMLSPDVPPAKDGREGTSGDAPAVDLTKRPSPDASGPAADAVHADPKPATPDQPPVGIPSKNFLVPARPQQGGGKAAPDVFSIQEIEAEFARLLGRRPDTPN